MHGFTCRDVCRGAHDRGRSLEWRASPIRRGFELAREAGLAGVLRPGPHVNAELTSFGMPDHVLAQPQCQARTARGTPVWMPTPPRAWPVPSYASSAFRARVATWFAAVREVIEPFLGDPVVAVGIDNEAQMFFRLGAYDFDYHPDAIAWWNEASGLDGDPPRAWDAAEAARCASWVRFKDHYIARALGEFAQAFPASRSFTTCRRVIMAATICADPARDRRPRRHRRVHGACGFRELRAARSAWERVADPDRVRGRHRLLPVVPPLGDDRDLDASAITC
jgi:hypothetical protein